MTSTDSPTGPTELGSDRRTFFKRSAVVGGALVWATPVVQSIGGTAFAATGSPSPSKGKAHFGLNIGSTPDIPAVSLTNQSDNGASITEFTLTIMSSTTNGQPYQWDSITVTGTPAGGYTVNSPTDHGAEGGKRSQILDISFNGGGLPARGNDTFQAEMDFGGKEKATDWRYVLRNVPNSRATGSNATYSVSFSDGTNYTGAVPDGPAPGDSTPISVVR